MRYLTLLTLLSCTALAQALPHQYGSRGRDNLGPSNPTGGTGSLSMLSLGDGSAVAPSLTFTADPDTGLFRPSSNSVAISTGGLATATFDTAGITVGAARYLAFGSGSYVLADTGTASTPAYAFVGDQNTGFYNVGADQLGVTTAGARSFNFNATAGRLEGTTSTPYLQLDNAAGSCLNYTGASLCVTSNQVSASGTSGFNISVGTPFTIGARVVLSGATPTVSSGFGTTPSVTAGYATAFRVNVGTGGVATSGVITVGATATTGWNCDCTDLTTTSATVFMCKMTASTTTTVTIGNFSTAGASAAWAASDILAVSCVGF